MLRQAHLFKIKLDLIVILMMDKIVARTKVLTVTIQTVICA